MLKLRPQSLRLRFYVSICSWNELQKYFVTHPSVDAVTIATFPSSRLFEAAVELILEVQIVAQNPLTLDHSLMFQAMLSKKLERSETFSQRGGREVGKRQTCTETSLPKYSPLPPPQKRKKKKDTINFDN